MLVGGVDLLLLWALFQLYNGLYIECICLFVQHLWLERGFMVAAIGPMAPPPSPVFRALAFIFSMAPILRVASIKEAKPHALELRGLLSGPINRQDLQLYLRSKGLRASEQTRCSICAMDAMQCSISGQTSIYTYLCPAVAWNLPML